MSEKPIENVLDKSIEKPFGRPERPIDWNLFEELCRLQCTQSEIASVLKFNRNTIRERVLGHYGEDYEAAYKRFSELGKSNLRRSQLKLSQKNAGMAIFLGKNWLGQKDNEQIINIAPELSEQFAAIMNQLKEGQKVIHAQDVSHESLPCPTDQSLPDKS